MTEFRLIDDRDDLWERTAEYAAGCPWRAGASLAEKMRRHVFHDWERVIVILENEKIRGFCTVTENDNMPDLTWTPFIGYVFVDPECRGKRYSEKMLRCAEEYMRQLGFAEVHVMSDHEGLYEKFGYEPAGKAQDIKGRCETVFRKVL